MNKHLFRIVIIVVSVSFLLSVIAGAAEVAAPHYSDAISLGDYPFEITNNNDGTETVVSTIEADPIWTFNITKPSDLSGWYTVNNNPFEITSADYEGQFLITGYVWPNGRIIDVSDLDPDAVFNVNYDASFRLTVPPYPYASGEVYVSLVPRFRLLRETGGQIAFVVGESVWNSMINEDDYGDDLIINAQASQPIDLNVYNALPDLPLKFIEIKWQFNIRFENVSGSFGMQFSMLKDRMSFSYDRDHVKTESELAAALRDDVDSITSDLGSAGDAFNDVYRPSDLNFDDVIISPDVLYEQVSYDFFSEMIGGIASHTLIMVYLTLTASVVCVSYVIFGKKGSG